MTQVASPLGDQTDGGGADFADLHRATAQIAARNLAGLPSEIVNDGALRTLNPPPRPLGVAFPNFNRAERTRWALAKW